MQKTIEEFNLLLEQENKEAVVEFILAKLQSKETDVITLYTEILTPALNLMECKVEDKRICIWKEHVRTGIVRTIVECCFPYVIEKRNILNYTKKGIAVVLCPPEEYHDLGARMVADFLTICGYNTVFVGSNTPYEDFYNAIDIIHPNLIAISVSNYYNLVVTKKIIADLKKSVKYKIKIVAGGSAFNDNMDNFKSVDADYYANTFDDLVKISEGKV